MTHFPNYKILACLCLSLCIGCSTSTNETSDTDTPDVEDVSSDETELDSLSEEEFDEQFAQARDLMDRGRQEEAFDILIGIENADAPDYIEYRATVEISNAHTRQGNEKLASFKRNTVVSKLKEMCSSITADAKYEILLAEAYAGKPDLEAAIQILNNAKSKYPDKESQGQLAENSSRLYFEAAKKIGSLEEEQNFKDKLDLLCLSLSYDETNKKSQHLLLAEYIFPRLNEDQQAWIADAAIGGKYPAGVRVTIGMRAAIRNNFDTASKNLRTAANANQGVGLMVNGLAYYSIYSRTIPDDRMVELVEMAVDIFPNTPQLLRTRGTLNMFMNNFEDAASDFQAYLDAATDEFCIWSRRMMAEAYRKTGNSAAAELADMRIKKAMNNLPSKEKQVADAILQKVNVKVREFVN